MKGALASHLAATARGGLAIATLALLTACSGAQADVAPPPPVAPPPVPAAKLPPPASPIEDALPSLVPPSLPQRATCRIGTCTLTNPVPEDVLKQLPQRGPLVIWEQRLGGKARVAFPTDKEVELAGVVLEGSVGLLSRENQWGGKPAKMPQWQGFYAPGGGVTLTGMDNRPARIALVMALVTTSADASLADHVARWRKNKRPFQWKQREKPIAQIDFTSLPAVSWGNGAFHARIGWDVPANPGGSPGAQGAADAGLSTAPSMVVNLLRFSRDAGVAAHVHEKEQECLAILEGQGDLLLSLEPLGQGAAPSKDAAAPSKDAAAPSEDGGVAVEPGMVACIPNGMWHSFKPSGQSPLLAIQVYAPPGPELRFKRLAAKEQ